MKSLNPDVDFDDLADIDSGNPERNLLSAIMQRAIDDAYGTSMDVPKHERRGARSWLASNKEKKWSFRWTCTLLDLDYISVRAHLEVRSTLAVKNLSTSHTLNVAKKRKSI